MDQSNKKTSLIFLIIVIVIVIFAVLTLNTFKIKPSSVSNNNASPTNIDSKVYTVKEIFDILNNNPDELKNKIIKVKAYRISFVAGLDCKDYSILIDRENAELYKSQYDFKLSFQEREKKSFSKLS